MARGGSRQGAGRKKGVPNRRTKETVAAAEASGEMPLDYMLRVMRDPRATPSRQDAMAKAAAPYCHAALKAVEHSGPGGGPIGISAIEWHVVRTAGA